jgi:DNA/RNA endonuclease G (NUC1)
MRLLPRVGVLLLGLILASGLARATIDATIQDQLGDPYPASAIPGDHSHLLIRRPQYTLDYDDTTEQPNWVSWDLTSGDIGSSGRGTFQADTTLPAGYHVVQATDYSGSGYDRGHMCPSADRTVTVADNEVLFYMSNMIPQAPDNNQGVWESLESYCRDLANAGNEVLITSGPSLFGGSHIAGGPAIAGYTWKIAVVVPLGSGTALSRVTASTRVIAVKIPNIAGVRSDPWQKYVVPVTQIETDTGYSFFSNITDPTIKAALKAEVDGGGTVAPGSPAITTVPVAQNSAVNGAATFSVVASGAAPLAYQWQKDDGPIVGATNSSLVISNVQASDAGAYDVVVSNSVGSVVSAAANLVVTGIAPTIAASPASQSVAAGSTVTLAGSVGGSPALTYKWYKDTVQISGQTGGALVLNNVQSGDAGSYNFVVTNSVGSASSSPAVLSVTASAPSIVTGPASQTVTLGAGAAFSVSAVGSNPLSYAWAKGGTALSDGGNIAGSHSATLTVSNVSSGDNGTYTVTVSNTTGSATSGAATLTASATPVTSTLSWTFGASTPVATPSGLPADITGGAVSIGNTFGTVSTPIATTSASTNAPTYSSPAPSGTENEGNAARIGALVQTGTLTTGSAYFEFTLTPSGGKELLVSAINFGTRATGTGPQAYSIYSSADGYATALASGSIIVASTPWAYKTNPLSVTGGVGAAVTFRIFGYNGVGSPSQSTINWRIDDLAVTAATTVAAPVAPTVVTTVPTAGTPAAASNTPVTVTFSEPVILGGSWFALTGTQSGSLSATVTAGAAPNSYILTPPVSFADNETVTVTVLSGQVTDSTGSLHLAADYSFSFNTAAPVAPTIAQAPVPATVLAGGTATFTVAAAGTSPFSYQWHLAGGANIGGGGSGTSPALTLANVALTDTGNYVCDITNSVGVVSTVPVALTVLAAPPAITAQPAAITQPVGLGGIAAFTVTNSGTAPFGYQWYRGTTPLADNAEISGSGTATLNLAGTTAADAGTYSVTISNAAGTVTSSPATLNVGSTAAQNTILWNFTGGTGAPASGLTTNVSGGTITQGNNNGTTALVTSTSASNNSGASGGNNAGAAARVNSASPAIDLTPQTGSTYFDFTLNASAGNQVVVLGMNFGERSTSTGPQAYAIYSSADNFTAPLATGSFSNDSVWRLITPVFSAVGSPVGGPLTLRLFGYGGSGSPAAGTANWRIDDLKILATGVPPVPPSITTQPAGVAVVSGSNVSFSVAAAGSPNLTYQWLWYGVPVMGNASATSATLSIPAARAALSGPYWCVVTNPGGSVTSARAQLFMTRAPASITLGNLTQTFTGSPLSVTTATNPAGLAVAVSYSGNSAPTAVGSYSVAATINDLDYSGSATGTLVIQAAPGTGSPAGGGTTVAAPAIIIPPAGYAGTAGTAATLSVSASAGGGTLSYQWSKNGVTLPGATGASLALSGTVTDTGSYTVAITNSAGTVTSAAVAVSITEPPPVPPAPVRYAGIYFGTLSGGGTFALQIFDDNTGVFLAFTPSSGTAYVSRGVTVDSTGHFSFTTTITSSGSAATGALISSLQPRALVPDLTSAASFSGSISADGSLSASGNGLALAGAVTASGPTAALAGFYQANAAGSSSTTLAIISPAGQAFVLTQTGGTIDGASGTIDSNGNASLTTAGGQKVTIAISGTQFTDTTTSLGGTVVTYSGTAGTGPGVASQRVVNLSARGFVGAGGQTVSTGFVIAGVESKPVLIRAVGPTLSSFGIAAALPAPKLDLYNANGAIIATNTGWKTGGNANLVGSITAASSAAGAFPLASAADSALMLTLAPGKYTAVIRSGDGSTGVAMVEFYDLAGASPNQKLVNLSASALAGTGANALAAGVIVSGAVPQRLLVRAAGPGLAPFGVPGVLARPVLNFYSGSTVVATNSGWSTSPDVAAIADAATRTGAFPFAVNALDAGIIVNLAAGSYTAQVTSADGASGFTLLEIYAVP